MKGKKASSLIALCAAVYFCSYLTRQNYATVLVEIIESEGVSKAAASAAITGMFITYGLGQITCRQEAPADIAISIPKNTT